MRHNGTRASGWTDGLHPAPWVTLQYVGLCANALADLEELGRGVPLQRRDVEHSDGFSPARRGASGVVRKASQGG